MTFQLPVRQCFALAVAALLTLPFSARAQENSTFDIGVLSSDFFSDVEEIYDEVVDDLHVRVGVGTAVSPSFEGDDDYDFRVYPRLTLRWRDRVLLSNTRLYIIAWKGDEVLFGPIVQFDFGRDENDDIELTGLGNVANALEVGGFVHWQPGWIFVGLDVAADVLGKRDGVLATLLVGTELPVNEGWKVQVGGQLQWADGTYMDRFFGVTPAQSAASGLPVFDASGGFKDIGARVKVKYSASKHWRFSAAIGYERLLSDAADSPLVRQRGSRNQFIGTLAAQYRF